MAPWGARCFGGRSAVGAPKGALKESPPSLERSAHEKVGPKGPHKKRPGREPRLSGRETTQPWGMSEAVGPRRFPRTKVKRPDLLASQVQASAMTLRGDLTVGRVSGMPPQDRRGLASPTRPLGFGSWRADAGAYPRAIGARRWRLALPGGGRRRFHLATTSSWNRVQPFFEIAPGSCHASSENHGGGRTSTLDGRAASTRSHMS